MKLVESYLRTLEQENGFSGAALISLCGEIISVNGYGYANYEHLVRNTPKSKFCIASISKQFTAAAIYILIEKGHLKSDDTIADYLPNLPATWRPVIINQLLSHTSGIPDYVGFVDWRSTGKYLHSPLEIVGLVSEKALDFSPGSKFSYCGTGYLLLGMLIEAVSGVSYSEFLQKNIFDRLALNDTGVLPSSRLLPHRAYGYEVIAGSIENEDGFDMSFAFAAGNLYSTVEDLHCWSKAFFSGKVVSDASLQKMMTPTSVFSEYGSGLEIGLFRNRPVIGHKGGIGNFSSIIQNFTSDDLKVIVLSNVETINLPKLDEMALKLADLVLG
ncbi:serine hydrolase domain-containing protein [Reinekea sp.]|jgi:CubicO group peptidase (beta-lactamase class C family)|uniref:serine hydrolase domain-containing protein n=1 Tax=Reinekea sp. TaxID=1970455 RepID=UPI003988EE4D